MPEKVLHTEVMSTLLCLIWLYKSLNNGFRYSQFASRREKINSPIRKLNVLKQHQRWPALSSSRRNQADDFSLVQRSTSRGC